MTASGERDLRQRLRALRDDPPDEGFASELHRRLASAGPPEEPSFWRRVASNRRVLWPALGAGAVAAALATFMLAHPQKRIPAPNGSVAAELPATKVAVVRVNLSAEVAVESASITVTLPEGLVFWAEGRELAQRSFQWTQPLRPGDNEIPIAVRGSYPGRFRLTVTAQVGDQQIEEQVLLEVVDG